MRASWWCVVLAVTWLSADPARAFELRRPAFDGTVPSAKVGEGPVVPGFVFGEGAREGAAWWKAGVEMIHLGLNLVGPAALSYVVLRALPLAIPLPGRAFAVPLSSLALAAVVAGPFLVVAGGGVLLAAVVRTAVGDALDAAWLAGPGSDGRFDGLAFGPAPVGVAGGCMTPGPARDEGAAGTYSTSFQGQPRQVVGCP